MVGPHVLRGDVVSSIVQQIDDAVCETYFAAAMDSVRDLIDHSRTSGDDLSRCTYSPDLDAAQEASAAERRMYEEFDSVIRPGRGIVHSISWSALGDDQIFTDIGQLLQTTLRGHQVEWIIQDEIGITVPMSALEQVAARALSEAETASRLPFDESRLTEPAPDLGVPLPLHVRMGIEMRRR